MPTKAGRSTLTQQQFIHEALDGFTDLPGRVYCGVCLVVGSLGFGKPQQRVGPCIVISIASWDRITRVPAYRARTRAPVPVPVPVPEHDAASLLASQQTAHPRLDAADLSLLRERPLCGLGLSSGRRITVAGRCPPPYRSNGSRPMQPLLALTASADIHRSGRPCPVFATRVFSATQGVSRCRQHGLPISAAQGNYQDKNLVPHSLFACFEAGVGKQQGLVTGDTYSVRTMYDGVRGGPFWAHGTNHCAGSVILNFSDAPSEIGPDSWERRHARPEKAGRRSSSGAHMIARCKTAEGQPFVCTCVALASQVPEDGEIRRREPCALQLASAQPVTACANQRRGGKQRRQLLRKGCRSLIEVN
ncbi:hypothetical protein BDV95DRAFT_589567 [Massariosphaeria phaeospora]|uniref:Uncharacterized protein n=1 Tax=Massariosphaeria phaeospora TaxID=100035 RepID=A0A7C8IDF9_9PLEO|nr:hypothetical protein BDV95DRAFT_589567 [Massariosphaeria phaeospora]